MFYVISKNSHQEGVDTELLCAENFIDLNLNGPGKANVRSAQILQKCDYKGFSGSKFIPEKNMMEPGYRDLKETDQAMYEKTTTREAEDRLNVANSACWPEDMELDEHTMPVKKFKEMSLKEARTESAASVDLSSTFSFERLSSQTINLKEENIVHITEAEYNERLLNTMSFCHVHPQLGESLLHSAILADNEALAICMVQEMVTYDYLSVKNFRMETPLHLAVICNMPILTRTIIKYGSEVSVRNKYGDTPLHIACRNGSLECAKVLTKHLTFDEVKNVVYRVPFRLIPQDLELRNYEGLTCLHLAVMNNHRDVAEYLVKSMCAKVETQDGKSGKTALHIATEKNQLNLVKFLVKSGANVNAEMYNRRTPLDIATEKEYEDLKSFLLHAGARKSDNEETDSDMET